MAETRIILENKQVIYTGLFRMDELYSIIKNQANTRGYYILETRNQEDVTPEGKTVMLEIVPQKSMSDYVKSLIRINVEVKGLKDKAVTIDGHQQKYQQGSVRIIVFAFIVTDRRSQWEGSGFAFVLRTFMDKFIRHDLTHKTEEEIKSDATSIINELKSYLNMSRFKISSTMHPQ